MTPAAEFRTRARRIAGQRCQLILLEQNPDECMATRRRAGAMELILLGVEDALTACADILNPPPIVPARFTWEQQMRGGLRQW